MKQGCRSELSHALSSRALRWKSLFGTNNKAAFELSQRSAYGHFGVAHGYKRCTLAYRKGSRTFKITGGKDRKQAQPFRAFTR